MKIAVRRNHLYVAAALLALALLAALGASFALDVYRRAQTRMGDLEPRYARLQGISAKAEELQLTDAKATALLTRLAYPATLEVTQAGNDAQQRLRTVFLGAGLEVMSSQVLPAKVEKEFDRIPAFGTAGR